MRRNQRLYHITALVIRFVVNNKHGTLTLFIASSNIKIDELALYFESGPRAPVAFVLASLHCKTASGTARTRLLACVKTEEAKIVTSQGQRWHANACSKLIICVHLVQGCRSIAHGLYSMRCPRGNEENIKS